MSVVRRPRIRICVLGAGISGLSTAVQIQNSGLDASVTIVADKFLSETTSSAAAGLCTPHFLQNTPLHLQRRWHQATFERLRELYLSEECSQSGVTRLSGYMLFPDNDPNELNPYWKNIVENFQVLSEDDMKQFPRSKSGIFLTTFLSESLPYLQFLSKKFKSKGGHEVKRKVNKLEELYADYDIVVNCSGIIAKELLQDTECEPVRGQVVRVRAPWVKHFYIEIPSYIIPVVDEVVLGGTHQQGRWDTAVDLKDSADILRGTSTLLPSLRRAEIVKHKVGIRPARTSVRLERQDVFHGGRRVPLIHNYGHGGAGFAIHWGCSMDAGQLVVEAARNITKISKL